ncbi:hypothetical protein RJ639_017527, partial [Escallonia herrerae]
MKTCKLSIIVAVVLLLLTVHPCHGISESCMKAYNQGGAPAVLQSPDCSQWVLSTRSLVNQTTNCEFVNNIGEALYQEDHISCNIDMQIPLPGKDGPKDVRVGVVAVFDGHMGEEASRMSSELLLQYYLLHSAFIVNGNKEQVVGFAEHYGDGSNLTSSNAVRLVISEELTHKRILKEALLRTIRDIDLTFSKASEELLLAFDVEALEKGLSAGTTATVAVLVHGQILVANVGDSKAILCSEKRDSHQKIKGTFFATELTSDHHPTRADERARIKEAGGFVFGMGNKMFFNDFYWFTRAIGNVALKRYGVTAEPEVTDWQPLTTNDSYLVLATSGVLKKLSSQDVCDLFPAPNWKYKKPT